MSNIARLIILIASLAIGVAAQITAVPIDHEDLQSWNEVQLTVPMSKQVDFLSRLTLRFGNDVSRLIERRYTVGFAWKPTTAISISPFYSYVDARNSTGRFRIENRLNLAATYHFPIKRFGLSHRSTVERRLRLPENSWRYRAQLTFDKDIPSKVIPKTKFFMSDEVFYDSILERFSRNRFAVGVTKTITQNLALDIYYMRQNDGVSRPGDLNIIGTAWKIKL